MKLWRKTQIIGVAIFLSGFILGFAIIIRGGGLDAARSIASPITYIGLFITGISVMLKLKTRDALNILKITISQILSLIFIFMFLSSITIQWYFDKKGDVE